MFDLQENKYFLFLLFTKSDDFSHKMISLFNSFFPVGLKPDPDPSDK